MATVKKEYEVLNEFSLNSTSPLFEVGAVIKLTPLQAKKFADNVKEVESKLSREDKKEDSGEDEDRLENTSSASNKVQDEPEDYLRKYQVRKQTVPGSRDSDPVPGSKAAKMKAHLLSQPKVSTFIQRSQGEDKSVLQTVNLNGYRLDFPKQAYIDLPKQISDILRVSLQQTEDALQTDRVENLKEFGKSEDQLS